MYVSQLSCPKCSATYESEELIQLCECGAPLLVDYDLPKVQSVLTKEMLKELGVKILAMPTNGNTGAAWAVYSVAAGIQCVHP
jgi:threonine synthase